MLKYWIWFIPNIDDLSAFTHWHWLKKLDLSDVLVYSTNRLWKINKPSSISISIRSNPGCVFRWIYQTAPDKERADHCWILTVFSGACSPRVVAQIWIWLGEDPPSAHPDGTVTFSPSEHINTRPVNSLIASASNPRQATNTIVIPTMLMLFTWDRSYHTTKHGVSNSSNT